LPIKQNRIYFVSNFGDKFSCNPRAFFEYLYKNHKDEFDFKWILNDKQLVSLLPSDVKSAKRGSLKDYFYFYTSKFIVNNMRFSKLYSKRKSQFYIQTWHGGPVPEKMIEKDAQDKLSKNYVDSAKIDSKNINLLLANSDSIKKMYENCFWYGGEISNFGTPRYDCLFHITQEETKKIKQSLGIEENSKVVVYAPTFRNNSPVEESFFDDKKVIVAFQKMFHDKNVVLLYRFHPNTLSKTKDLKFGENVFNVTSYPDIQDIVKIADAFITDFSSCIYDAMIAGKICFTYKYNIEQYINQERNLYSQKGDSPFPVAFNQKELVKNIENFDVSNMSNYQKKVKDFFGANGITENGCACKNLYDRIEKEIVSIK
jgi:CDP-glycerol glycerophosphotransferase